MAITAEVCRLCRREGAKLYLKGERCYSRKCAFERRSYPPGQHGQRGTTKIKEYGVQLREKQKMRRIYGVRERQFRVYLQAAMRKRGVTGETLLQLLELRLDNVVYRLGFVASRAQARELVSHGHFLVNGRKVNTPSYRVKQDDVIEVRETSKDLPPIVSALEVTAGGRVPSWLEPDADKRQGRVHHVPMRDEIDTQVDETLIVEFYSR
ncbi:MAG TPA: 30S ribosomal protein S4 [Armatimonadota bacterium]|nr:30S ribosomal protein S4 [Armatimonadota bacterium]